MCFNLLLSTIPSFVTEMVSIHRRYTVTPSDPTPTAKLCLSHCDQFKLPTHGSQLYIYTNPFKPSTSSSPNSNSNSILHTFKTSLSKALSHYYPIAGRLCGTQGGRYQLVCNAKGVIVIEATCEDERLNLSDFWNNNETQVVEKLLVPNIDYGSCSIEEVPLLLVQLTRFPCGGFILGVAFCRAIGDGACLGNFMMLWAKLAKGEDLDPSLLHPLLDRTLLDSRNLHTIPRFDHPEFSPPPAGALVHTKVEKTATAVLKLSKEQVQKLKKKASDFGNVVPPLHRPYSSFEVIGGHLWRCLCKVRYESYASNGNQKTRLATLVNCRNRLNPPLPNAYFGNATFPTVTQNCSFKDIVNNPLSYAVNNLREAIERMSDKYVRSALGYIANQKDMNLLREKFYNAGGQFRGNPNLYLVSWTNFPFYALDFGWGKPVNFGPGHMDTDGKAFLLNNVNGDGFVVAICLLASHVDGLKKLFYEDVELLPTSRL